DERRGVLVSLGDDPLRAERAGDAGGLRGGDLAQRRQATDGLVAAAQLVEQLRLRRAAASGGRVVRLPVVERRRRAAGHDQAAAGHVRTVPAVWTRSTTRSRTAGSVSGKTPWSRLKMWPGWPSFSARTARTSAATASHGPRQTAGSRLPCSALPGATRWRAVE